MPHAPQQIPGQEKCREFINIAGYKFVALDELPQRRNWLLKWGRRLGLKGTILLSHEGINLFLAGGKVAVDSFLAELHRDPCFAGLAVKRSISDEQPFSRLLVRIKREIIALGVESVNPAVTTSPKIQPRQLKEWLDQGKSLTLLDVRNNYEIEIGTFENAVAANIESFRQFPAAIENLPLPGKAQPIVMFCTGGIRCEKAGPLMQQAGFEAVYQLDGGILQYFQDCGGAHYRGECFVFDKRVALDDQLSETDTTVCFACQHVLLPSDLQSDKYRPGATCPYCYRTEQQTMQSRMANRQNAMRHATQPLPGSVPYDNVRPINVPGRFDGVTLIEFLCQFHPHIGAQAWQEKIVRGLLTYQGRPLSAVDPVRAGQRIDHSIPATIEPDVNRNVQLIYEDDWVVAVNKPAPLPMHPSGRFNRNTLQHFLNLVYQRPLRSAHRLDANTTGIVLLSKGRNTAAQLQTQFEQQRVQKVYLARVSGSPPRDAFTVRHPIADEPVIAGGRTTAGSGRASVTEFRVIRRGRDSTLLEAQPITGRTNQIRVHLWQDGMPIVGDPTYGMARQIYPKQTLDIDDPPMCLHASKITFAHPANREEMTLSAPPPDWLVD